MRFDESTQFLVLSNIVTIIVAVYEHWRWAEVMWIYWGQSMVIGFFTVRRILCMKQFSIDGVTEDGKRVKPTKANQRLDAYFFVLAYGIIHAVYCFFLVMFSLEGNLSRHETPGILGCIAVFVFNHYFSFRRNLEKDLSRKPNIGTVMAFPFARILPMHITIIIGCSLTNRTTGILVLFLCLKTVADVIMHRVAHREDRQPSGDDAGKPAPQPPTRIRDIRDVEAFMSATTKDEALAEFLVDVAEHVGRDGYIAVECGGNGTPYEVEYQKESDDNRKVSEIQAELQRMRQALVLTQHDSERDHIERQIAELAGGFCTIRINVKSYDKFSRQKALIIDTWAKFKEITRKTK